MTLLGNILRELDGQLFFRVAPGLGDAPALRFPLRSEFWVKRAQCHRVRYAVERGQLDEIELSAELASLKAQTLVQGGC